jgi:hypothetical protein
MVRWCPKERAGSVYDPGIFLETPEQARRLITHLREQLSRADRERNRELASELVGILVRVESLAQRFFHWERSMSRVVTADEIEEIKKLPIGL